ASIGIMAPVLLLVARLVQGFSTGGEYGGAATFIAEFSTDKRRGFMGSFLEFGTLIGYVLGAGVVALLTASLSQEALLSWGWRVPFLASIALVGLGWFIRAKVPESPDFEKVRKQGKAEKSPVTAALRRHPREVL
ncbi:MFS transporter, partial [Bacillus subtilis]|nr:MFS transporter [Bacillus subtilis]